MVTIQNNKKESVTRMLEALAKLDLLVMLSRWHETFGLVGLEALLV